MMLNSLPPQDVPFQRVFGSVPTFLKISSMPTYFLRLPGNLLESLIITSYENNHSYAV
jgi:hypothetical protein